MRRDPSYLASQIPDDLKFVIVCDPNETAIQFSLARTFIGQRHRYIHHDYLSEIIDKDIQQVFLIGSQKFHEFPPSKRIAIAEVAFAKNPGMLLTRTSPGREMALWIRQRRNVLQRNLWPTLAEISQDLLGSSPVDIPSSH